MQKRCQLDIVLMCIYKKFTNTLITFLQYTQTDIQRKQSNDVLINLNQLQISCKKHSERPHQT